MVPADVRDAGYYTTRGALLSGQGHPKDAIDAFQIALRNGVADADQAVVRLSLAAAFEQMGSVPSAVEQYEKVLQLGANTRVQQHAQKALLRLEKPVSKPSAVAPDAALVVDTVP
jgi:tetratricopeptide (TPR) repeat protein